MPEIAFCVGSLAIHWSSLLLVLAALSGFCLSYALYAREGRGLTLWVFLPLALLLSLLLARLVHGYCHTEQYGGLLRALTSFSGGGFWLAGVPLGVFLAAYAACRLTGEKPAAFWDALAPGTALCLALLRLSNGFGSACRAKVVVSDPRFQRLPFAAPVTVAGGELQYRLASFFFSFLLLLGLTAILLWALPKSRRLRWKRGPQQGHVALLFLLLYAAGELLIDSSRYDSSFFRSNGFVSLMQILCALIFVAVLVFYSVLSVREHGLRPRYFLLWALFLAALGGAGYLEYLVQRHGDWYKLCYGLMAPCSLLAASIPLLLARGLWEAREES